MKTALFLSMLFASSLTFAAVESDAWINCDHVDPAPSAFVAPVVTEDEAPMDDCGYTAASTIKGESVLTGLGSASGALSDEDIAIMASVRPADAKVVIVGCTH